MATTKPLKGILKKPRPSPAQIETNEKQQRHRQVVEAAVRDKVDKDKTVFQLQELFLETVSPSLLEAALLIFKPDNYVDVVEERVCAHVCGYPLCSNEMSGGYPKAGPKYRISLSRRQIYDLTERKLFCSDKCCADSHLFSRQLSDEAPHLRPDKNFATARAIIADTRAAIGVPSVVRGSNDMVLVKKDMTPRVSDKKMEIIENLHPSPVSVPAVVPGSESQIEGYSIQPFTPHTAQVKTKVSIWRGKQQQQHQQQQQQQQQQQPLQPSLQLEPMTIETNPSISGTMMSSVVPLKALQPLPWDEDMVSEGDDEELTLAASVLETLSLAETNTITATGTRTVMAGTTTSVTAPAVAKAEVHRPQGDAKKGDAMLDGVGEEEDDSDDDESFLFNDEEEEEDEEEDEEEEEDDDSEEGSESTHRGVEGQTVNRTALQEQIKMNRFVESMSLASVGTSKTKNKTVNRSKKASQSSLGQLSPFQILWQNLNHWCSTVTRAVVKGTEDTEPDENGVPLGCLRFPAEMVHKQRLIAQHVAKHLDLIKPTLGLAFLREQNLSRLISSFEVLHPVPSLKARQWLCVCLVLLDVTTRFDSQLKQQIYQQKHTTFIQMVRSTGINVEEFQSLVDIFC